MQSYRYNSNTSKRVNSSFVSMLVQAAGTMISYVSDRGEVMYDATPVRRRQWTLGATTAGAE